MTTSQGIPITERQSAPQRRSSIFSALAFRNYRLFWFGQIISVTGTFMQSTAQSWLVLLLTSNALALGIVGALQFGPSLLPIGAIFADRWPRRRILIITQAIQAALAFILWGLTATHLVQLWHIYVLALLLGTVNAIDLPTRQAFVSEMVPRDSLLNAVSLNSAQFNVARILGPAFAGEAIAQLGVPLMFLFNALSFFAVIGGLVMMRPSELQPVPRSATQGAGRLSAMREGLTFLLDDPTLRITFLMVAVIGAMGFNFNVLLPLQAHTVLHGDSRVFGWLTSALGVGALSGALLLARRSGPPTNRLLLGMAFAFGLLELSEAFAHSIPLALALMACLGFTMSSFAASANTRIQLASPPELRGRVMAVYSMVFIGTTPIGNLLISSFAGAAGVGAGWALAALPCVAVAIAAAALWRRQERAPLAPTIPVTPTTNPSPTDLPRSAASAPEARRAITEAAITGAASATARKTPRAPGLPQLQPRAADHE